MQILKTKKELPDTEKPRPGIPFSEAAPGGKSKLSEGVSPLVVINRHRRAVGIGGTVSVLRKPFVIIHILIPEMLILLIFVICHLDCGNTAVNFRVVSGLRDDFIICTILTPFPRR